MSKKSKTPKQPAQDEKGSAPIYDALARLRITSIEVIYDGCSDSGCIEAVTGLDAKGNPIDGLLNEQVTIMRCTSNWDAAAKTWKDTLAPATVPLAEAITDWCYDVLEEHFPGWGNDDGAHGTITIDVATRRGTFEHNERVIETISHEGSF